MILPGYFRARVDTPVVRVGGSIPNRLNRFSEPSNSLIRLSQKLSKSAVDGDSYRELDTVIA